MRFLFGALAALVLCVGVRPAAAAEPMKLVTIDFAPIFGIVENDKPPSGFSVEILRELAKRVGSDQSVEILPVARMQEVVTTNPNYLSVATLTEWRKPLYTWIAEEASDQIVLAAPKGKRVPNIDALPKDSEIGVLLSSTMEKMAKDKGFTRISAIKAESSNLKKLQEGRIAAWLSYSSLIGYECSKAGVAKNSFDFSEPVSVIRVYLVTSKDTKEEVYAPYRDAFAAMRKDGGYEKILSKYSGMVQPPIGP